MVQAIGRHPRSDRPAEFVGGIRIAWTQDKPLESTEMTLKYWFRRLAALALVGAAPAFGAQLTLTFSGTVDHADPGNSGGTASGSLTLDPSTFQYKTGDGITYNFYSGEYLNSGTCPGCTPQQSNPLQVSGHYTYGSHPVSLGGGTSYDYGSINIYRNFESWGANQVDWFAISEDVYGSARVFSLTVRDTLGTASKIFRDVNGGLDVGQGINWLAPGATSTFEVDVYSVGDSGYVLTSVEAGSLTTAEVTSAVPEPASRALWLGGVLLGAGWALRRRFAAC
jgi:hypothetical protein